MSDTQKNEQSSQDAGMSRIGSSGLLSKFLIRHRKDPEPIADISKCSECGWKGPISECETEEEGDWETGYYDVHVCPKCEDGGCVDDYEMSEGRAKEREEWNLRNR